MRAAPTNAAFKPAEDTSKAFAENRVCRDAFSQRLLAGQPGHLAPLLLHHAVLLSFLAGILGPTWACFRTLESSFAFCALSLTILVALSSPLAFAIPVLASAIEELSKIMLFVHRRETRPLA